MAMITVSKSFNSKGDELRLFECLRCGNGDPEKVIQRKPKTAA
jgi:hypothetical protein